MQKKEWFILIDSKKEGPYSVADLRSDRRVTPDTLVWKPGFEDWVPMRKVLELKKVFEDNESEQDQGTKPAAPALPENDTLALVSEPPYFWIIIALIVVAYAFYQFFSFRH